MVTATLEFAGTLSTYVPLVSVVTQFVVCDTHTFAPETPLLPEVTSVPMNWTVTPASVVVGGTEASDVPDPEPPGAEDPDPEPPGVDGPDPDPGFTLPVPVPLDCVGR
jgi:hypothetical protein